MKVFYLSHMSKLFLKRFVWVSIYMTVFFVYSIKKDYDDSEILCRFARAFVDKQWKELHNVLKCEKR